MMTWLARDFTIPEVQRVVAIGNLTAFVILVFVDLHGVLTGAINGQGRSIFWQTHSSLWDFFYSLFQVHPTLSEL